MSMMDSTEELMSVAQEAVNDFDQITEKSLETWHKIHTSLRKIIQLKKLTEEKAKDEIEALISQEQELENTSDSNDQTSILAQQEQQLSQEINTLQINVQELSAQNERLEKKKRELSEENEVLLEEKDRLENETTIMIPKRKEELSLYNLVSRTKWDFDGSKDEIKGYVHNTTEVRPFAFDQRKCSQYFITNAIWDLMKEDGVE